MTLCDNRFTIPTNTFECRMPSNLGRKGRENVHFRKQTRKYIIDRTFYNVQSSVSNKDQLTFSLNASHFLLNGDCFDCTMTMSVFVLLSPVDV